MKWLAQEQKFEFWWLWSKPNTLIHSGWPKTPWNPRWYIQCNPLNWHLPGSLFMCHSTIPRGRGSKEEEVWTRKQWARVAFTCLLLFHSLLFFEIQGVVDEKVMVPGRWRWATPTKVGLMDDPALLPTKPPGFWVATVETQYSSYNALFLTRLRTCDMFTINQVAQSLVLYATNSR